jgi:hypothetical protein
MVLRLRGVNVTDLKTAHGLTGFETATFNHLGFAIFSGFLVKKIVGIGDSEPLDGTQYLLTWKEIVYTANLNDSDERIYIFTRSGSTSDLSGIEWSSPSLNDTTSLSDTGRYLQVRIVIVGTKAIPSPYQGYTPSSIGPTISQMTIKGVTSASAALFYTETFELGFFPQSIVMTKEADVPEGLLLRFGVTSLDSVDLADYQFVDTDSVVELDELAVTGTKIKFVIEMSGNSGTPVTVHEFAAMFSGEGQKKINS